MSTDLFNAAADITRPLGVDPNYRDDGDYFPEETLAAPVDVSVIDEPRKQLVAAKPVPADLKQYEYDDIGLGWCIHCGYSVEWDEGRADVWIHTLDLNTGQHLIPLTLTDIPGADLKGIEAVIADVEEGEAYEAARHLAETRNDDGDYSLDAQRDKLAAKEPTESQR